ncbi:hypothetical protein EJB05_17140, partial [Eragrostis curvula]
MDILSRGLQDMASLDGSSGFASGASSRRRSGADGVDEEEALRWAALERLPSFERLRTGLMRAEADANGSRRFAHEEVDVRALGLAQRQAFVERVFRVAEEDNARFLARLRARIDRAGIQVPTVEVRFKDLSVAAECHVGTRALPTLTNATRDVADWLLGLLGAKLARTKTLHILKGVSGVVKPSRMTLLLGPPSSGKTTLLLALAGKLDPTLKVTGEVTYNGYGLGEFVPQKTAAYISQNDVHDGAMTVKEILDFSARCQGVGQRYELLKELAKKEKEKGVYPDPEVDLFMKATSVNGATLQTDYILRILGLDMCADVLVGDQMRRGISGGQKKRLTTEKMDAVPTNAVSILLAPDGRRLGFAVLENSGLFTNKEWYWIATAALLGFTILFNGMFTLSLMYLNPVGKPQAILPEETNINLEDTQEGKKITDMAQRAAAPTPEPISSNSMVVLDKLLLLKRGGQVIYSGPLGRNSHKVVEYFEQYVHEWNNLFLHHKVSCLLANSCFSVSRVVFRQNKALVQELSKPPPGSTDIYFATQYSQSTFDQFRLCFWKQWLTYWRSPDYNLVRVFFALFTAVLLGAIFWRVGNKMRSLTDLLVIIGSMFAAVLFVGVENCITVQPVVAVERTVFYRERAAGMYSAIPYAFAQVIVEIPYVFVESASYTLIVYSMMSFQWTPAKFFWFFYISFFTFLYFTYYGMMSVSISPNDQVASIFAAAFYSLFNLFSGFFIPRSKIPKWWVWYYWLCPVAWTVYGLVVSQYGDVEDLIKVPGQPDQQARLFIKDYFGYDPDFMGVVAAVLAGFAVLFASLYAYCIKTFNFQQR